MSLLRLAPSIVSTPLNSLHRRSGGQVPITVPVVSNELVEFCKEYWCMPFKKRYAFPSCPMMHRMCAHRHKRRASQQQVNKPDWETSQQSVCAVWPSCIFNGKDDDSRKQDGSHFTSYLKRIAELFLNERGKSTPKRGSLTCSGKRLSAHDALQHF